MERFYVESEYDFFNSACHIGSTNAFCQQQREFFPLYKMQINSKHISESSKVSLMSDSQPLLHIKCSWGVLKIPELGWYSTWINPDPPRLSSRRETL